MCAVPARVAGVDEVYRVGGAQAVAAMAYGTESVRRVDVIVGPGNRYVAEAMRQVSGAVGIPAAFAGPSEVVVVAGPETPAELAAIDLAVQAEHGPDGLSWLVTWSTEKLDEVDAALDRIVARSPRRAELEATLSSGGYGCLVEGPEEAIAVANVVAPEHLELMIDDARRLLGLVQSAGAVFLGPWSPASLGDYVAGPNHVLPTNRSARFSSALSARDFRRHIHVVEADRDALGSLGPHVVALANTEGLPAHAESIEVRR
jgi:histidinol dehydrogenase